MSKHAAFRAAKQSTPSLTPLVFFYENFYDTLFELLPEARPLFKRRLKAQGSMLANVIRYIAANAEEDDESFAEPLRHLARLHVERGIIAEHFSIMGLTLLVAVRTYSLLSFLYCMCVSFHQSARCSHTESETLFIVLHCYRQMLRPGAL
jgi:hypothetical protein